MRLLRTAVLVLAAVCAHAASFTVTPTTTLTAETGNNTSAASTWTASSNGNLGASNISKADHRTLLYPGATTAIYSHLLLWFGPSNHIQVGYRSDDFNQIKRQVDDHISRGLAGAIIDWYGTSHTVDTTATLYLKQYAESLPGYPFKFALMEDKGALLGCAHVSGCDITAQLISDLTYIVDTFAGSPAYIKHDGRPVILFFGLEAYTIDWERVKAGVPGNPVFIFENAGGFSQTASDGGFGWVQINTGNSNDWMQGYLDYFYSYAHNFPQQHTFGAVYKGFNDTMASWSQNRIMSQQCGQVWLNTWNEVAQHYSASNQLEAMQLVTWNDYEEGTAIEPGIENCLSISASVTGSILSWTVSGNENTLDHYTVFISRDGENLMSLAEVTPGLHSLDLSQFELGPGNYVLHVKAVGKPSIVNHMSTAASVTVGEPPVAALTVSPESGIAPVTVTATATSNTAAATVIDFGEGSPVRASSASHTYTVPGTYTVTASVTDAYGLSGNATQTVTIAPNQPPTALLTVSPTSARAGSVFTASAASSSDPDDVVVASIIDFGDGFVTEGFTASHAYAGGGNYTVTARVTDSRGARSVATSTITVGDFVLTANAADPAKPTLVVTVSPRPELKETVSLSCPGLAAGYSCRFDSAAVDLAGGPAISTLTVSTNPATARKSSPAPLLASCLPLACIIATGISRRVIRYGLLGLAALSLLLTLSCGGGSTQSQAKRIPVTICGTVGSLQRSITTSVTIP